MHWSNTSDNFPVKSCAPLCNFTGFLLPLIWDWNSVFVVMQSLGIGVIMGSLWKHQLEISKSVRWMLDWTIDRVESCLAQISYASFTLWIGSEWGNFCHFWRVSSMWARKCVRVCLCVWALLCCLYFPPNPTSFTSSKMLKCANLQHDTFSMKRKKKKKKKTDSVRGIKIPSFSCSCS